MAGSIGDVIQVVVRALAENAALQTLVGGRVYGRHFRQTEAAVATYPLIIVSMAGGGMGYEGTVQADDLEILAYSRESQDEAVRIYDAIVAAIQAYCLTVTGVTAVVVCEESTRPSDGWNEDAEAWYVTGGWIARTVA